MINILEFYNNNREFYPVPYLTSITLTTSMQLVFPSEKNIISQFKFLLNPKQVEERNMETFEGYEIQYLLICFFLHIKWYQIANHINELENPNYENFGHNVIKSATRTKYNIEGDQVKGHKRIQYINENIQLTKGVSLIEASAGLNSIMENISINNSSFNSLTLDEKLREIRNAYENISDHFGGYAKIPFDDCFLGYITNDSMKIYFKKTQVFRHNTELSIKERDGITDKEKEYMVNFGIVVLNRLTEYIQTNKLILKSQD